jgi:uroporphyrinogen III methyltransferase/synthase
VVTRAPEQSKELLDRLRAAGAEAISLPLVRFLEPQDTVDLDRAIRSLGEFDWLVFTSANAVTFFLKRCRALGGSPAGEDGSQGLPNLPKNIAAVGSATRLALDKEGLRATIVPEEFNAAQLAAKLSPVIFGTSVLLPRSDRATEELPLMLRKAGANLTEVIAYRTAGPASIDAALVETLRGGRADAVTFFSPSAFREFQNLVGAGGPDQWNSRVALAAVGPVTAEAIRRAGWPLAIEADEATTASLVAALERHFAATSDESRGGAPNGPASNRRDE